MSGEYASSDQKLIDIVIALAGNEFAPISIKEIADRTEIKVSTVAAKIQSLMAAGWVEKESDRYRLGIGIIKIAHWFYQGTAIHAREEIRTFERLTGQNEGGKTDEA